LAVGCGRAAKATTVMGKTPLALRQSYCCGRESATHKIRNGMLGGQEKQ
jgi:hypothetical protein